MIEKTTSSKASCSPRETGLENKTEPAGPKMVEARPQVLKIPKNLFVLVEARSARGALYDVIGEVEQLLRIMRNEPIDPFFKNKIYLQIDAGETLLAEYQQKLNELVGIYSGSCQDIDQLTYDLTAYKQRFNMVKEECMYLLPERTPNISSPSVAKSQPSIAENSDVQHSEVTSETAEPTCKENVQHKERSLSNEVLTRAKALQQSTQRVESLCSDTARSLPSSSMHGTEGQDIFQEAETLLDMEHTAYNLQSLFAEVGHPEEQGTQLEAEGPSGIPTAPGMHETEGQGIPQETDGEDETYNLASLFAEVGHPESQDIQQGAGIAPAFEVRDTDEHGTKHVAQNQLFPENEIISEATGSSYKKK